MAWSETFLQKKRRAWLRSIARAQYYSSTTNSWYEGFISEKTVEGDTIKIKFQTTDELDLTITQIRLIDTDGDIAYSEARNIIKNASQGALLQIEAPIVEE